MRRIQAGPLALSLWIVLLATGRKPSAVVSSLAQLADRLGRQAVANIGP